MSLNRSSNERIISIDLLRILSMIIIFLFHSNVHISCTYGIMTTFISQGAVFMDMFFMISGFSLFYTNYKKDMHSVTEIKNFWIKRIAGIYPVYMVICLIYLIFNIDTEFSLLKKIIVLPMDMLMLQSSVNGTFGTLHHGGTWFVSCLFFCYLLSPFLIEVIKQISMRTKCVSGGVTYLACSYIPVMSHIIGYDSTYSSILYRSMHFFIGMIIASVFLNSKQKFTERTNAIISLAALAILIMGVSLLKYCIGGSFNDYDFFVIPLCAVIVYFSSFLKFCGKYVNKIVNNKVIKHLNSIAYEFFIGQFFCFIITKKIILQINADLYDNNTVKIIASLLICFVIAVMFHELVGKPCKKLIQNKLIRIE